MREFNRFSKDKHLLNAAPSIQSYHVPPLEVLKYPDIDAFGEFSCELKRISKLHMSHVKNSSSIECWKLFTFELNKLNKQRRVSKCI